MKTFVLVVTLLVLAPAGASAQKPNPNAPLTKEEEMLTFFPTPEACVAAYKSGNFLGYLPHPKNLRTPPVGAVIPPRPLCAHEDVREFSGGHLAWVILIGVPVDLKDGAPVLDGRCWNTIHDYVWLDLPTGPQGPAGPMGPQGPQGLTGLQGPAGKDGRTPLLKSCPDGSTTLSNLECPEPRVVEEDEGPSNWAVTVGVGTFSSVPVEGIVRKFMEDIETVCVSGITKEIGLAYRPDTDSPWLLRGTFGVKTYSTESFTEKCPECANLPTTFTPGDDMKAWFVSGEVVRSFTQWKVRPTLAAGMDMERLVGTANHTLLTQVTRSRITNSVAAPLMFGRESAFKVTPTLKAGVTVKPNDHLTGILYLAGFRWPGAYSITGVSAGNNKVTYGAELAIAVHW